MNKMNLKEFVLKEVKKIHENYNKQQLSKKFHDFVYRYTDIENSDDDKILKSFDDLSSELLKADFLLSDLKKEIDIQQNIINDLKNNPKINNNYVDGMQSVLENFKNVIGKRMEEF